MGGSAATGGTSYVTSSATSTMETGSKNAGNGYVTIIGPLLPSCP
jgi:hypothetical protein